MKEKRKKTPLLDNINGYPLDEYQSNVVLSDEESTLVIAGAGAGKSLTIIGKIIYLVKECRIKEEEILCISFTNDATKNLQNNLNLKYNLNIKVYTFHKLSLELLKGNNEQYNIAPDNFLEEKINYFFKQVIPNNEIFKKALRIILGKKYTDGDIENLKRLIKTFISLYKSNDHKITYFLKILKKLNYLFFLKDSKKNKYLILLIFNIYIMYENELKVENAIDFNDMINKAVDSIKRNGVRTKYKYIIIDEYQDTSITKFYLLKELQKQTSARLLAVGDDFQSIYRFTGCTLNIFLNFKKYYDNSKIFYIINTYRNPQELIDIAGKFIMKNKHQYKKRLISPKHINYPIEIIYTNNRIVSLKKLLTKLEGKEIMVLGRNNNDIYKYIDKKYKQENNYFKYNKINFRYMTIHKSKGLESEIVILINVENSNVGLPTKIKNEKILNYVNKVNDSYPFEEERRLFYVALTRTKTKVYIISSYKNESIFIKEIKKDKRIKKIKE